MPKFCTNCGSELQYQEAEICPKCCVRIKSPTITKKQDTGMSTLFLIATGIGILFLVVIFVGAVIAAFVFGMAGNISGV